MGSEAEDMKERLRRQLVEALSGRMQVEDGELKELIDQMVQEEGLRRYLPLSQIGRAHV